jgi:hypothetical protein
MIYPASRSIVCLWHASVVVGALSLMQIAIELLPPIGGAS